MSAPSRYDYGVRVAVLSRCAVFRQAAHPSGRFGAVALKVTAAQTAPHEAAIYARLCPHPSIPDFVELAEDRFDTSHFSAREHHRGVQRLHVLVTRFVRAAALGRLFHSFPVIRWSVAVSVAQKVAVVLRHVHERGVVYGDLKLPNVLLGAEGHVWLVDYASAVVVRKNNNNDNNNDNENDENNKREDAHDDGDPANLGIEGDVEREEFARGITCHIRAPELFAVSDATLKHPFMVDFWAFGAFILELLTGRPCLGSFEERSGSYTQAELEAKVLSGHSLAKQRYSSHPCTSDVWDALKELLLGLMHRSPECRLGFRGGWDDVLKHRFFECVARDLLAAFPPEYEEEIDELMLGL